MYEIYLIEGNSTKDRIDIINNINKSFIIMKSLCAERIPPDERLKFVFDNNKENDMITIGFGNEYEIDECMKYYDKYFR